MCLLQEEFRAEKVQSGGILKSYSKKEGYLEDPKALKLQAAPLAPVHKSPSSH